MEALKLEAEIRETVGKQTKHLRKQGLIPAVLYGRDFKSKPIQINAKALTKVLHVAGTHQLISLEVDGKPQMTLAREIQRDKIKRDYLHVDFYAVKMDEKVTAHVPLIVEGNAPAVKDKGGILTQGLDDLEIECLPKDLISSIEVNVEGLVDFNDSVIVADLKVPRTITILSDPESMVVKIEAPRKVEEVEALLEGEEVVVEEEVSAEPEVLTAAKEEE